MSVSEKAKTAGNEVYRRVRFPGICEFSRCYGYNYTSVYKHLTGARPSKTMAAKWAAWKAGRAS